MSRVLLIAPSVDRDDVGEAWVAYQWASRLSERHELTVLTHRKRTRASAVGQLPHAEVVEWDEPPLLGRAERFNSLLKPWYPAFHHRCRRWIRDALAAGRSFDIAHQPVPVAMRYPSPLQGTGLPYVLGPVGGSMDTPPGFADGETAPWYVGLRGLDAVRLRRDPVLRRTYREAALVLGIAPYVADLLSAVDVRDFRVLSETAVTSVPPVVVRDHGRRPVRLLFVGRLIRTKGARDAVRALGHLRDLPVHLDVVGDGFDRAACEELAARLGVGSAVTFHGAQPRDRVDRFYRDADVFVFPSYREPGGNVAFEAMSWGLPVVTSDRGGPGAAVDDGSGFRISPVDPEQFARDIAAAVRRLVDDPSLRARLGEHARARVLHGATWEHRVAQLEAHYERIVGAARDSGRPAALG